MDIIKVSEDFAKKEYAKHDKAHSWSHVKEVMDIALKLAKSYPKADLEILKLTIIFHDISYQSYETHVEDSIKVAKKFLSKKGYPKNRIEKVLRVMIAHSGPHRRKLGDTKLIEGKIIYDADKFKYAKTSEGFKKYYPRFYLNKTKELIKKIVPKLFFKGNF